MSKRQLPELINFDTGLKVIEGFFPAYLQALQSTTIDAWGQFWDAILDFDLLTAIDVGLSAFSRLPFTPLIAAVDSLGEAIIAEGAYYRRFVITGEQAVELVVRSVRESFLANAWLTNDSLLDLLLQWFAGVVWGFLTRNNIIFKIIRFSGITSEAQLLSILKGSALKALWMAVVQVALVFFALGFAVLSFLTIGLNWPDLFNALPQDSRRVFGRRPGLHRVNAGKGPDA